MKTPDDGVACCPPSIDVPELVPLSDDDPDAAREARRRSAGMLDGVVDAHTHLFPDGIYTALWKWFDQNAWSIRFRAGAEQVLDELSRVGIRTPVALIYAHKEGVSESLNRFLGEMCRAHPGVVGVGTVMPGEPDALRLARDAIEKHGLRGLKLHCHVQRMAIDDPRILDVLRLCAEMDVPAVVHCGREPAAAAYGVNPYAICHVERTRNVLRMLPRLKLVVPHVGADEYAQYMALLDEHEGLYLDTAMGCAEYFRVRPDWNDVEKHASRIMYGSDFPITPYEADREMRVLARRISDDGALEQILRGTAKRLWGLTS